MIDVFLINSIIIFMSIVLVCILSLFILWGLGFFDTSESPENKIVYFNGAPQCKWCDVCAIGIKDNVPLCEKHLRQGANDFTANEW